MIGVLAEPAHCLYYISCATAIHTKPCADTCNKAGKRLVATDKQGISLDELATVINDVEAAELECWEETGEHFGEAYVAVKDACQAIREQIEMRK